MGVWGYGRKKPSHTSILPYSHTEWKPEPNAELHKLMHASVVTKADLREMELRMRLYNGSMAAAIIAILAALNFFVS